MHNLCRKQAVFEYLNIIRIDLLSTLCEGSNSNSLSSSFTGKKIHCLAPGCCAVEGTASVSFPVSKGGSETAAKNEK